jgi:mycothione reductase
VEKGVFGGTCLNVGCIPTKMFVHPADLAASVDHARALGVDLSLDGVHWRAIRDRIFRRIDPISLAGRNYRADQLENVTLYEGHARFTAPHTLDTGTGQTITADQIVLAAGSRAVVPEIPGLDQVEHHTSDTIMRIDDLPGRLAIIGGGFVAAEFAHIFGSFGTEVSLLNRSGALLRGEDEDVSRAFTDLARRRWDVHLDTTTSKVERYDGGARLHLEGPDGPGVLDVDLVLVATGRRSNAEALDPHLAGVEVDDGGLVVVDDYQRTTAEGVWALGDISNRYQLKHVSNHEARVVQHNLLHLDDPDAMVKANHDAVPSAVFTSPQIASVGLTEQEAREQGVAYVTARQTYGDTAFGWAMEDTTSFAKVLADPQTGRLLGAHVMGDQASNIIQPLIGAMAFGQTAHAVARGQYWIHPALSEVIENVLLGVDVDAPRTTTPG